MSEPAAGRSVEQRFADALTGQDQTGRDDSERDLPARLARAAAAALSAPGAGISLLTDEPLRRLPLGASDIQATLAEQLQFTTGEGPCLAAHRMGQPTFSDEVDLQRRWAAFSELLTRRTTYTAVGSLPLRDRTGAFGALDLYFTSAEQLRDLDVLAAVLTAGIVAEHLTLAAMLQPADPVEADSPWFHGPAAPRLTTWQAIGMLIAVHPIDPDQALQRLRRHALGRHTTTDTVSAAIVSGDLHPTDL